MELSSAMYPPITGPLRDVKTECLELRRFAVDDLEALALVFARPEVWRHPFGRGFTRQETGAFLETQMRNWSLTGFGLWLAAERSTGRVVGFVGLSVPTFLPEVLPAVEVGWRLDPDVWGRGYATEGAAAAIDEAFGALGLDEVCSVPQTTNRASIRVAERLGMCLVRPVVIPATPARDGLEASLYRITKSEWGRAVNRQAPTLGRSHGALAQAHSSRVDDQGRSLP